MEGTVATIQLDAGQAIRVVSPSPIAPGARVSVVVRPQKLAVGSTEGGNRLSGRVVSTSYLGASAVYEIDIGKETIVRANTLLSGPILREGEQADLGFAPEGCVLLDAGGRRVV